MLYRPDKARAVVDGTNTTVQDLMESIVPAAQRAMEYDRNADLNHAKAFCGLLAKVRRTLDNLERSGLAEVASAEKRLRASQRQ